MATRQKRNSKFGTWIVPIFCILVSVYFVNHAFQGKRGLEAMARLLDKESSLRSELADLRLQRDKIETKVALLRSGSVEKDMLDEQARYHLNLMRDDEFVIFDVNRTQ